MVFVTSAGEIAGNSLGTSDAYGYFWADGADNGGLGGGLCSTFAGYQSPIDLGGSSINLSTGVLTLTAAGGPTMGGYTFTVPMSPMLATPPASLAALEGTWSTYFPPTSSYPYGGEQPCVSASSSQSCQFVIDANGNVTSTDINGTGTGTVSIPNAAGQHHRPTPVLPYRS